MKILKAIIAVLALCCSLQTAAQTVLDQLLPRPQHVELRRGTYRGDLNDVRVKIVSPRQLGTFDYDLPGFPNEGYRLRITPRAITITAATELGVLRARQTLAQLVGGALPCCDIVDFPAFKYRGWMHDVGRSYITFAELKHEIELLARFKVNVFHWHLTDNQGFRFESRRHPQLNRAGYERFEGCYYTQVQCRELEAFAAERGMVIIPEIDMPGHSRSFETAMGVTMASEEGRAILKDVLEELSETFPRAPYLHIGADESGATEAFVREMTDHLHALGRKTACWNRYGAGALVNPASMGIDLTTNWATSGTLVEGIPNVDMRYYYANHFDVFADLAGIYRSTIFGQQRGSSNVAGVSLGIWNDRFIADERQIVAQNNLYANVLALAERAWQGGGTAYIEDGGALLPLPSEASPSEATVPGSYLPGVDLAGSEHAAFADWERRFLHYKATWLAAEPIPYVRQSNLRWAITTTPASPLTPNPSPLTPNPSPLTQAAGAGVWLNHIWAGTVGGVLGKEPQPFGQTRYATTYIYSPEEQTAGAQIEFRNYSRSDRGLVPQDGQWDIMGSRVWLNDHELLPTWHWTGAGTNPTLEDDLGNLNFPARRPLPVHLRAGWNKVVLELPYIDIGRDNGRQNKWQFTFVLTDPEGRNALDGIVYAPGHVEQHPAVVQGLLDRIDTSHTLSRHLTTRLDPSLSAADGIERYVIDGTTITGSTILAITKGINDYLNHHAHVNLSWNQLDADFSDVNLPRVKAAERLVCDAPLRYYLNYCTFGYSMATWTWERWEQEIDWMALHGINMPLQIVGLEEVWRRTLRHYNYTDAEAKAFAAGPAFTAWWGMNNLEEWGGTQDDAWFERQARLARKICDRMREYGMEPVLPGFAATVPHDFTEKNPAYATESQGNWGASFVRPYIMDPTGDKFQEVAATYYSALTEVMGPSRYYSIDPFHEGGAIRSKKYAEGYRAIFDAMDANCGGQSQWVIQQWQWAPQQAESLTAVPAGRLIVLDLFSDGNPAFDRYDGYAPQQAIYCVIPNFGGRTGMMGRLPKMADNFARFCQQYPTIRGIGAAPEAIEQTPVAYDLLYDLPWRTLSPLPLEGGEPLAAIDTKEWLRDYVHARYGCQNADALAAWEILRTTVLDNRTTLQGPHEAVMCARPSLEVKSVSKWGGSDIFYNPADLRTAARHLLAAAREIGTDATSAANTAAAIGARNMSYDLCDVVRQVASDYSKTLLDEIRTAYETGDSIAFRDRRDRFLQLILDTDRLLGTNRLFRLGNWTETARAAAAEACRPLTSNPSTLTPPPSTLTSKEDWYEHDNARTLITVWGDREACEWGLRDYSYRQWQGMLRDFYYPRWHYYFCHDTWPDGSTRSLSVPEGGWYDMEYRWVHTPNRYSPEPEGDTYEIARELLDKIDAAH